MPETSPHESPGPVEEALPPAAEFDTLPDEGAALSAHAPPFVVAADECVVATSSRTRDIGAVPVRFSTTVSYARRSYDPLRRLRTELPLDNQGQPARSATALSRVNYHAFSAEGRELLFALPKGDQLMRVDYARDEHGNLVSARESYVQSLDEELQTQGSLLYGFSNSYDDAGRLVQRVTTGGQWGSPTPVTYVYRHDDQGRCSGVATPERSERWDYDAQGRLALLHIELSDSADDQYDSASSYEIRQRYDEQGRLIAIEQDGGGLFELPMDGTIDSATLHHYQADGSLSSEYIDGLTDYGIDPLPNGRTGHHYFELLSPGCQALEASIPSPSSLGCKTD